MLQTPNLRYVSRKLWVPRQFHSKRSTAQSQVRSHFKWRNVSYVRLGSLLACACAIGYDGVVNDFTYCGSFVRFGRSLKTATLIAVDYLGLNEIDPDYEQKRKVVHQTSANRLLETCLLNGGLYIKVGQGFAAINHILPIEYTETLAKLQDKCLPTSKEDIQKVFRKDFGKLPEKIYKEFDYTPVAAASLAQVFKARLHNGQQVAVKVQYSDLQKRFISDLATIIFLQDLIELIFKDYNFGWILNDLRKNLVQELNFEQEGKNAERCARDLRNLSYVHVPKVYWGFTKKRVLTLEWIDGVKVSDLASIKKLGLSLKDVDQKLFTMCAQQIFKSGFVHADPHPGNIFVRKNKRNGKADIVILDHGLYEEMPRSVRVALSQFWVASVQRDEMGMKAAARRMNVVDYMKFASVLFQQPVTIEGPRIRSKLTQEDVDHIQKVAKEQFEIIMSTLREMPRCLLFVTRNLNTVRAISNMHGDVVDRPCLMARFAQRSIYDHSSRSPLEYFNWLTRRVYFEYCLWISAFKIRLIDWYLNFLYLVGRAPEGARSLMKDAMDQEKQVLR
ncbi:uncharacterized aarF domain-containing protein kinase 5 isoform X1 [Drosophila mojavensis]|uniref:Uncharacterized protein, isoform A n=1 Tax=Drosophila mojavensis TaxID=7230 RepID=B4L185_DROMO|nr:uncharacterized aarF domain-containing protein kinase 5 isoform X1 [Drosophila mojavensis]EDW19267.1 uncharacterized protein Dmoj_GI13688, isoform A [Drosophila mojavensis]